MANEGQVLEGFRSAFASGVEQGDHLFNRIMEPSMKAFDYVNKNLPRNFHSDLPQMDLPQIELSGFEQESGHKSDGVVSDVIHGIKKFFGKDDTIKDKLREKVEKDMTPSEQRRFEDENKAIKEYERRLLAWQTQMTMNPGPIPEKPATPMHKEIERRVQSLELQLSENVRERMSKEDRSRLYDQFKKYEDEFADSRRIRNPLGTGEFFKRAPEPGNAIKDYFDRIKEESERFLSK